MIPRYSSVVVLVAVAVVGTVVVLDSVSYDLVSPLSNPSFDARVLVIELINLESSESPTVSLPPLKEADTPPELNLVTSSLIVSDEYINIFVVAPVDVFFTTIV